MFLNINIKYYIRCKIYYNLLYINNAIITTTTTNNNK